MLVLTIHVLVLKSQISFSPLHILTGCLVTHHHLAERLILYRVTVSRSLLAGHPSIYTTCDMLTGCSSILSLLMSFFSVR